LQFLLYSGAEIAGAIVAFALFICCRRHLLEDDEPEPAMVSKLLSEFLGTYVLVLTVCLVVVQASKAPLAGVVGIAASLMVMIYALGAVSGGNFNPAVSLGLLLTGNLPFMEFGLYVISQVIGGCAAVGTAALMYQHKWPVALVADVPPGSHVEAAAGQGSWGAICGAELFYTFVLVLVVLNVAIRDAPNQYYGLAIGFVIIAGGCAVGGLSGGCFNPAVALSLDFGGIFGDGKEKYGSGLVYAAAELVGAAVAAGVFLGVSQTEEEDEEYAYSRPSTEMEEEGNTNMDLDDLPSSRVPLAGRQG